MAEAYCGPSNALQDFQKHSSVDRTLQQDRLTQRRVPLENFRSPDQYAGALDPEFEAFQASQPGPLPFAEPAATLSHQSLNQRGKQPVFGPSSNALEWASDFQRLQLQSPSPGPQHAFLPAHQQALPSQPVNPAPAISQPSCAPAFTQSAYRGYGAYGLLSGLSQGYMPQQTQQASTQNGHVADVFDDAAFERAFNFADEQIKQAALQDEPEYVDVIELLTRDQTPYPHLALLRMIMFSRLTNPTEENMHKFARQFSLLEKHDPMLIPQDQWYLFAPLFQTLTNSPNFPYAARYHLRERADDLYSKWTEAVGKPTSGQPDDRVEAAYEYYRKRLTRERSQYSESAPVTRSVTDDEMLHDIQQQIGRSKGRDVVERLWETMHPDELQIDPDVVSLERAMLQPLERSVADTLSQDPLAYVRQVTEAACFAPETVRVREYLRSIAGDTFQSDLSDVKVEPPEPLLPQEDDDRRQLDPDHDEGEDLARTAGELLDKLRDNHTSKFQNSAFLGLMRKLRDREVRVEGQEMVETNLSVLDGPSSAVGPDNHSLVTERTTAPGPPVAAETGGTMDRSDAAGQARRMDGEEVVRILTDEPGPLTQSPEYTMTSPFYDNQHAELGRRGIFSE